MRKIAKMTVLAICLASIGGCLVVPAGYYAGNYNEVYYMPPVPYPGIYYTPPIDYRRPRGVWYPWDGGRGGHHQRGGRR